MTEETPQAAVPETAAAPEQADAAPEQAGAAPEETRAAPGRRKRPGRIATVAGSLVLAAALVAGVGYTVMTVRDADRQAGAPVWRFPDKPADKKAKAAPKGLAALLVPYDSDTWSPGPDLGEYGADVQLGGAQATALRKEALRGLPRSQRQRLEKQIDRQRIKGLAMRSYLNVGKSQADALLASTVRVQLAQMGNQVAVRELATFQSEFFDALDVFRGGPAVKGHKNAKCFLSPKDADEQLDYMFCSASAGDVLVTVSAEGVKPLDAKAVAALLAEQLDRIAGQGEAA